MLDVFDPRQALLAMDDAARLTAVRGCMPRAHRRPTPLCSACNYEFGYGEPPAALFCTRPMFPKGDDFTTFSGMICPRCAVRPSDQLHTAIVGYLRKIKPDLTIIEMGTA
jgi:hypothetical protein